MKRAFLILAAVLLISTSSNCQWYHRQYGANDIFQLTSEQFNEALHKAKIGVRNGAIISIAGVIGIIGGIIEIQATKNVGEGFGILAGVGLIAISIPLEITGLTILGIYGSRENTIKEILKNSEIKIVVYNYQNKLVDSHGPASTGLSIVFRF
jgi:hypothetical protein